MAGEVSGDREALASFHDSYSSGALKLGMTPLWHDTIPLQVRPERNCCLGKSRCAEFSGGSQLTLTSGLFLPGEGDCLAGGRQAKGRPLSKNLISLRYFLGRTRTDFQLPCFFGSDEGFSWQTKDKFSDNCAVLVNACRAYPERWAGS